MKLKSIELTEKEFDFIIEWSNEGCWIPGYKFYERKFCSADLEVLQKLENKGFVLSIWDDYESNLAYHVTNLFEYLNNKENDNS